MRCILAFRLSYNREKNLRIASIEWFIEYSEKCQKQFNVTNEDLHLIEIGHRLTLKIEEELRLHVGSSAPSFGALRRIFTYWTEQIKAEKTHTKEPSHQHAKTSENVEISINTSGSSRTTNTDYAKHNTPQLNASNQHTTTLLVIFASVLILGAIFGRFAYKDRQISKLKEHIPSSSIEQLTNTVNQLREKDRDTKIAVKDTIIASVDQFYQDWVGDPIRINQVQKLNQLITSTVYLYPDSSAATALQIRLNHDKAQIEQEFQKIVRDFKQARTAFANVKLGQNLSEQSINSAYKYSNSLFPLLGRMEYTELNRSKDEMKKTQYLLNVYQYKLNSINQIINP